MYEFDPAAETVEVRRARLEQLIGRPVMLRTSDVMTNPYGDKDGINSANYLRQAGDEAPESEFLVSGIVEHVGDQLTPQYFKRAALTEPSVHFRHTVVYDRTGHVPRLAGGAPRAYVVLALIQPGTIEPLDEPQDFGLAA